MVSSITWNEELTHPLEVWMDRKISVATSAAVQTRVQPITEHNRRENSNPITHNNINVHVHHILTKYRQSKRKGSNNWGIKIPLMGKLQEDLCDSQSPAQDNTWNYLNKEKLGVECPPCKCIIIIMFDKTSKRRIVRSWYFLLYAES